MVPCHEPVTLLSHWTGGGGRTAIAHPTITKVHLRESPVLCMHATGHSSSSSPQAAVISSPASRLRSSPFCPSAHLQLTVRELLFDGGTDRFQWQETSGSLQPNLLLQAEPSSQLGNLHRALSNQVWSISKDGDFQGPCRPSSPASEIHLISRVFITYWETFTLRKHQDCQGYP